VRAACVSTFASASRRFDLFGSSAIAQGANIVRRELGLPATYVPSAAEFGAPLNVLHFVTKMEQKARVKQSKFSKKAASKSCERPELTL
jgi:hypothetical protein